MRKATLMAAGLVLALSGSAFAQSTVSPSSGTATGSSNGAVNTPNATGPDAASTGSVGALTLEKGASSFTESQARTRIEAAGFKELRDIKKNGDGIWEAAGMRDGKSVTVGLDYKGNVGALR